MTITSRPPTTATHVPARRRDAPDASACCSRRGATTVVVARLGVGALGAAWLAGCTCRSRRARRTCASRSSRRSATPIASGGARRRRSSSCSSATTRARASAARAATRCTCSASTRPSTRRRCSTSRATRAGTATRSTSATRRAPRAAGRRRRRPRRRADLVRGRRRLRRLHRAWSTGSAASTSTCPTVDARLVLGRVLRPGPQHMNGTQALSFSRDRHDFPHERHHPHAQPGAPDPRRDAPAAGADAERAGRVQAARAARPPRAARRHRHQGPLPPRPGRVLAEPRPDPERHDALHRRQLPRPRRAAPPASSPTSATTASSRAALTLARRRRRVGTLGVGGTSVVGTLELDGAARDPRAAIDACAALDELAADPGADRPVRPPRGAARTAGPLRASSPTPLHRRGRGPPRGPRHRRSCTRTRPPRSTRCARGAASWSRRAPRRGSRSATRCRSSTSVVDDRRDTALLLFPTKALAQDQLRSLRSWLVPGLRAVTYDGDTADRRPRVGPQERQRRAHQPRDAARGHPAVAQALGDVPHAAAYVVVDELHTLRGIFGVHVAHVLRRLRRLCEHYGSIPTFFFASATIGNPGELASALCGLAGRADRRRRRRRAPNACSRAGSGRCSTRTPARAASANIETAELLTRFVRAGSPDARVHAQPARRRGRRAVRAPAPRAASRPSSPTASPRTAPATSPRNAARSSSSSRADGCSASRPRTRSSSASTSAASTRSCSTASRARSRRCGNRPAGPGAPAGARPRCSSPATTSSTSGTSRIPTELDPPRARARGREPAEPVRVRAQVACAAHELPLTPDDERWFGAGLDDAVRELVHADLLTPRGGQHVLVGRPRRRRATSGCAADRRSSTGSSTSTSERTIGTVDDARVFSVAHPGAVYLHQGRQYRVERLDRDEHLALLEPYDDADEYTQAAHRRPTSRSSATTRSPPLGDAIVHLGIGRGAQPGGRVPAQADLDEQRHRGVRPRPARARARRRARAGTRSRPRSMEARRHRRRPSCSARCTRPSTA